MKSIKYIKCFMKYMYIKYFISLFEIIKNKDV